MTKQQIIDTISGVLKQIVDLTPAVIKTEKDAEPFALALYNQLIKGQKISAAQLKDLQAKSDDLSAQLQKPLPPATEDDV